MPDESAEEAARSFLNIAKDRWGRVRSARAALTQASKVKASATAAYELYARTADAALTNLYKTVETDFSRYYQFVNSDDEGAFRAELLPSSGSLDLKVDFYKIGMFLRLPTTAKGTKTAWASVCTWHSSSNSSVPSSATRCSTM